MSLKNIIPNTLLLILTCVLSLISSTLVGQKITRGPYLQLLSSTSTHIRFRTDVEDKPSVLIGKSPNNLSRTIKQVSSTKEHELKIDSLN